MLWRKNQNITSKSVKINGRPVLKILKINLKGEKKKKKNKYMLAVCWGESRKEDKLFS